MSTAITPAPASADDVLDMLMTGIGYLADADPAGLPSETLAGYLRALEQADAVAAVARGKLLAAFDAADGHLADGQRTTRAWLVRRLGITRRQAGQHLATAALARQHPRLLGGLRQGRALTTSVALQLAQWLRDIPARYADQAGQITVAAALAEADRPDPGAPAPPGRAAGPALPVPGRL
jgi:hypothetical protein